MPIPILNKLYSPQEFLWWERIKGIEKYLCLVATITLDQPMVACPFLCRIYSSGFYLKNDQAVDYKTVSQIPGFCGTSYEKSIWLTEVWESTRHDDPYDWYFRGYRFFIFNESEEKNLHPQYLLLKNFPSLDQASILH
jgi:hypothetical protein